MAICVFLFGAEMWKSQAYAISSTWNNDILLNRELRLWLPIVVSRFNEKLKKNFFCNFYTCLLGQLRLFSWYFLTALFPNL